MNYNVLIYSWVLSYHFFWINNVRSIYYLLKNKKQVFKTDIPYSYLLGTMQYISPKEHGCLWFDRNMNNIIFFIEVSDIYIEKLIMSPFLKMWVSIYIQIYAVFSALIHEPVFWLLYPSFAPLHSLHFLVPNLLLQICKRSGERFVKKWNKRIEYKFERV
jgi:hypothetical protein